MRWEMWAWGCLAAVLISAEMLVPGAFLLWLGLAAATMFVVVALVPDQTVLTQVVGFAIFSAFFIQVYRQFFRGRGRASDRPLLNRRAEQLVGRVVALDQAIVSGRGRMKVDDAFWVVHGPDLPLGAPVRIVRVDGMALVVEAVG